MANHKSAKKRIRQNAVRRLRNRYYKKTCRNAMRELRETQDAAKASEQLPRLFSMLDKLVKKGMVHRNYANNHKSKLSKYVNALKQDA